MSDYLKIVNEYDKKLPSVKILDLKEITRKFLEILEECINTDTNSALFEKLVLVYPSYYYPQNGDLFNINSNQVLYYLLNSDNAYSEIIKKHIYGYTYYNAESISKYFVENPKDEIKIERTNIEYEGKAYTIKGSTVESSYKVINDRSNNNQSNTGIISIDLAKLSLEETNNTTQNIEIIHETDNETIKDLKSSIQLHYPLVANSTNKIYYLFSNTGTIDKKQKGYGGIFLIFNDEPNVKLLNFFRIICNKLSTLVAINIYQYLLRRTQTESAINSILIDSYAHNISAHSLNFLQSLFNYRNENFLKQHYSIPHFGRLENLPLNTVSYSDFFTTNKNNKVDENSDALKHYDALGISDNSNTVFDTTLLDYIQYSHKFKNKDGKEIEANDLLKYNEGTGKLPMPLDYAIAPLLTYLRDKGAFWSGVIRNNKATPSRIVSMYDLLMEMFNNPLFIGSIMAAEEFFVIHIFVDIEKGLYKDENEQKPGHLLTINIKEFVEAEMQAKRSENGYEKYKYLNDHYSNLNFVRLGKKHATLRNALQQLTILLPGGDVGKHAFFTIVENTLRNAKHIVNDHRDYIKKNGLELHLQINGYNFLLQKKILDEVSDNKELITEKLKTNETGFKSQISARNDGELAQYLEKTIEISDKDLCKKIAKFLIDDKELYQIGINLNYQKETGSELTYEFPDSEIDAQTEQFNLIKTVINSSYEPILTKDSQPRMGGSSQDKVCAAALFNKTFTSAEYPHKDVAGYYPWIAYNLYPDSPQPIKKNLIYNNELRKKKSLDEIRKYLESEIKEHKAQETTPKLDQNLSNLSNTTFNKKLYIKFFHIWKAENVLVFEKQIKDSDDNSRFIDTIPRYKIAVVKDNESKTALQKRAVIRILEDKNVSKDTERNFVERYKEWNKKWLEKSDKDGICFSKDDKIKFKNSDGNLLIDGKKDETKLREIKIDHDAGAKAADVCKIRNHGAFLKTILQNSNHIDFMKSEVKLGEAEQQELLETVLTKIFIAENRLFALVNNYTFAENSDLKKDKVLKETLQLKIVNENIQTIDDLKKEIEGPENQHFLIFHLSYAEKLSEEWKDEDNRYEKMIDAIFDLSGTTALPENTFMVMTTGRGREDWLGKTGRHRSHCIHVPIESLQTAIQQGVMFKDDFDIKYNLCKVLFGS